MNSVEHVLKKYFEGLLYTKGHVCPQYDPLRP